MVPPHTWGCWALPLTVLGQGKEGCWGSPTPRVRMGGLEVGSYCCSGICTSLTVRAEGDVGQAQGFKLPALTHSAEPARPRRYQCPSVEASPKPPGGQVSVRVRWAPGGDTFEVAAARRFLVTLATRLQKGHCGLGMFVAVLSLFEAWGLCTLNPCSNRGCSTSYCHRNAPALPGCHWGGMSCGCSAPTWQGLHPPLGLTGNLLPDQSQAKPHCSSAQLQGCIYSHCHPSPPPQSHPCKGSAGVIPGWPWAYVFIAIVIYIYLRFYIKFLI